MNLISSRSAALATGIAAMALAGCGSSSTLSRSQLVDKANAICAKENAQGNAIPRPQGRNLSSVATYLDKLIAVGNSATNDLQKLKPESSVSSDWNSYISARKQGIALVQTIAQKAHANDPSAAAQLGQVGPSAAQVRQAASKVGATQCAQ